MSATDRRVADGKRADAGQQVGNSDPGGPVSWWPPLRAAFTPCVALIERFAGRACLRRCSSSAHPAEGGSSLPNILLDRAGRALPPRQRRTASRSSLEPESSRRPTGTCSSSRTWCGSPRPAARTSARPPTRCSAPPCRRTASGGGRRSAGAHDDEQAAVPRWSAWAARRRAGPGRSRVRQHAPRDRGDRAHDTITPTKALSDEGDPASCWRRARGGGVPEGLTASWSPGDSRPAGRRPRPDPPAHRRPPDRARTAAGRAWERAGPDQAETYDCLVGHRAGRPTTCSGEACGGAGHGWPSSRWGRLTGKLAGTARQGGWPCALSAGQFSEAAKEARAVR